MSELAFSGLGYNPVTATSPCVNDHDAVAGGSSSGAAASVAFGLAAAAIGSDTGGSVRIPAVWNDLVGLKTTHGAISMKGAVPLCQRFDTVGPLCQSVEDAAALFDVLGGGGVDLAHASLEGVRFGALQTVVIDDLEDAPRAAYEHAVEAIKQSGAVVEPFTFPALDDAFAIAGPLFTAEAYGTWGEVIEASPDTMFAQVRERFRAGKSVAASDFVAGWQKLDRIRQEYASQAARFDGVLLPTAPIMPPNLARLTVEPEYFVEANLMALRNTRVANLLGLCSVTVPASHKSTGLTVNCLPMQDPKALRLAAAMSTIGA
jgi:aspartyl-tRNA(Asn)/glutamyl-tRNA(Gln) amidotransferase subunit A